MEHRANLVQVNSFPGGAALWLCAATVFNLTAQGPQPPTFAEQATLIQKAGQKAATYNSRLPDFLCTEIVNRAENVNSRGWRSLDALTVELSYNGGAEQYKLIAVNNRQKNSDYESLGGALSQGEFGSLLAEIVEPRKASFNWSSTEVVNGRPVQVFNYKMPLEVSEYRLKFSTRGGHLVQTSAGYHGTISIDTETGDILKVIRIADLSGDFPIVAARTEVEYRFQQVAGQPYLLPFLAEVELGMVNRGDRNEIRFLDYRKFEADSSLKLPSRQ